MNTPIIDPSTLTEEQRVRIKAKYKMVRNINVYTDKLLADNIAVFEWLFGEEFFKEEGE